MGAERPMNNFPDNDYPIPAVRLPPPYDAPEPFIQPPDHPHPREDNSTPAKKRTVCGFDRKIFWLLIAGLLFVTAGAGIGVGVGIGVTLQTRGAASANTDAPSASASGNNVAHPTAKVTTSTDSREPTSTMSSIPTDPTQGSSGWSSFDFKSTLAPGAGITAVSRMEGHLEVWWIAPDGSVQDANWYSERHSGNGWDQFQLAPAGSASTKGGIASVSRNSSSLEVWWVGPSGSIEGAAWYEGNGSGWRRYQLSAPKSAAVNTKIAAVSRVTNSMEIWWVSSDGAVQDAFFYDNAGWNKFQLALPGSADPGSGITAVSRISTSLEIWWVSPDGSVQDANWYSSTGWHSFTLSPAGSAALGCGMAAISRIPTSLEVWWVKPDGSVRDWNWYEGGRWNWFILAPAGAAAIGTAIGVTSRIPSSMEVWWVAPDGSVQDAYWYENQAWQRYAMSPPKSAQIGAIAAVSRNYGTMEVWFGSNGSVRDSRWPK